MAPSLINRLIRAPHWPLRRSHARADRPVLQALPPLLRPADPAFMAEWADGTFPLAGVTVRLDGQSPFAASLAPPAWQFALHGFGWLRHVPHAPDEATHDQVHALVGEWLARRDEQDQAVARGAATARRVMSWLAHADLLLETPDAAHFDSVLEALLDDVHHLEQRWRAFDTVGARLEALIALAQAGLSMAQSEARLAEAETALRGELNGRHGATTGPLQRRPEELVEALLDVEALRLLYALGSVPAPAVVKDLKAQLSNSLAGLLLGDGRPARLGTAREATDARPNLTVLERHAGTAGRGACHDPLAGYCRLALGETLIVVDVGAPYGAADALALEMSSATAPMLVHDGLTAQPGHGTVLFSTPPPAAGSEGHDRAPTLLPTHSVSVDLDDAGLQSLDATHTGHARRGFVHRRRVVLDQGGCHLDGIDELRPLVGETTPEAHFALRFVLHPQVKVVLAAASDQLDLTLPNDHRWRFVAPGRQLSVEGAVYRDGGRREPTLQILVPADTTNARMVAWQWTRIDPQRAHKNAEEQHDVDTPAKEA